MQMSQQEEDCLQHSDSRIKSLVLDQWKLFTHYKVRLQTHKNIGLARLVTLLANRKHHVKYDALHRLHKYAVFL